MKLQDVIDEANRLRVQTTDYSDWNTIVEGADGRKKPLRECTEADWRGLAEIEARAEAVFELTARIARDMATALERYGVEHSDELPEDVRLNLESTWEQLAAEIPEAAHRAATRAAATDLDHG